MYRFDWETPEGGGHMRSPHTIEIPFVFNNIEIAGPLISKMPEAYALAEKRARRGRRLRAPAIPTRRSCRSGRPIRPSARDTMLFNNECRVEQDPDRGPRLAMEQVLKLA